MTYVSFPGLGIEPFHMNRVLVSFGPFEINWYGFIICCGMILSVLYALHHAKMERVRTDDVLDLALALIICGVLGARLYYVVMEFDQYLVTDGSFLHNLGRTLYNCIAVWNGGLAIYGGIIAGFLAALVVARRKRIRFPVIADIAGPSVMVGQIIGRWGNFVNVEAYGSETALPWRMGVLTSFDGGASFVTEQYVHPTFLYESLWNLAGLVLITLLYKKKKYHGQMFLVNMTWYGFGRMLIEQLRADSLYIGNMRVSQFVGFVCFVIGTILLIVLGRRAHRKDAADDAAYAPVYGKMKETTNTEDEVPRASDDAAEKENTEENHGQTD